MYIPIGACVTIQWGELKGYKLLRKTSRAFFLVDEIHDEILEKMSWIDVTAARDQQGRIVNTTAREKEALGSDLVCHVCGLRLGGFYGNGQRVMPCHYDVAHKRKGKKRNGEHQGGVSQSSEVRKTEREDGTTEWLCKLCHARETTTEARARKYTHRGALP